MEFRNGARHLTGHVCMLTAIWSVSVSIGLTSQTSDQPGRTRRWPCVLIVKSPLLEVLEDAWDRSPTFRQQCQELADASAVVALQWGVEDSQSRARTSAQRRDGVIVAMVSVPTGSETMELVAHELHHVIEQIRGLDHKAETKRAGSGVWQVGSGRERYETQAAIEAGRQVVKEILLSRLETSRRKDP